MTEQKQLRPIISMGMFDMFKGLAAFMVVFGHTLDYLRPITNQSIGLSTALHYFSILGNITLFGFFIASGFGFRRRSEKKCLQQIWKMFLQPYVYTAVASLVLFLIVNFVLNAIPSGQIFGPAKSAIKQSIHYLAGFVIGQYPDAVYFGWEVYSCQFLWFFIAIAGGWFLLNEIMRISSEWKRHVMVSLFAVIACLGGYYLNRTQKTVPFCIFQIFIAVPGLYIGHLAKQHHWFEAKWKRWYLFPVIISLGIICWKNDKNFSYAYIGFPLGIATYIAGCILSLSVIYLFVHINRRYSPFVNFLEKNGFYTTYVICLHVVENVGMHWHVIQERFPNHLLLTTIVIFIGRVLFIIIGIVIINRFNKAGGWKGILRRKEPDPNL